MLAGIGDDDIRRQVLSTKDILSRSSFNIIYFVESKEMGSHGTEKTHVLNRRYLPYNV